MPPAFAVSANLLDNPEFLVGTASLIAVLLGAAVVLWALDRWRKKQTATLESAESLTDFRALFERGEISEVEYRRIRDKVSDRMRREVGLPRPVAPPPAAPDVPPDKPPDPAA